MPTVALMGFIEISSDIGQYDRQHRMDIEGLGISTLTTQMPFVLNGSDASYSAVLLSVISGGSGTVGDPYIIEGYNITTAVEVNISMQAGISEKNVSIGIIDVSDHIMIRNCAFGNASILDYSAISVDDSGNLTISGCNVTETYGPAFPIINSTDILVKNCILWETGNDGFASIYIEDSNRTQITDNLIANSGMIYLVNTNNSLIQNNEMHASMLSQLGAPSIGIGILGSNITVDNNIMVLSGSIYAFAGSGSYSDINITNNNLLNLQANHPSWGFMGAVTIDGGTGFLGRILVENNVIEGTQGDGIQIVMGTKGIISLNITKNNIFNSAGKGVDVDGKGFIAPKWLKIEYNTIKNNQLDGIYLEKTSGVNISRNYIYENHAPLFNPILPGSPIGFGGIPATGIILVDCQGSLGLEVLVSDNTIHENDYGIVLYDMILPNTYHIIRNNIISYNYYYGLAIFDFIAMNPLNPPSLWGQSVNNLIDDNDFHQNNLGNPNGLFTPEMYREPSQIFEEDTNALNSGGYGTNTWGGNYYNDEMGNNGVVLGFSQYWFDFDFTNLNPPNPSGGISPAGLENISPPTSPNINLAPIVTPLNSTDISVYNDTNTVLRWSLSDPNLNGMPNGLEAWGKWNGTDIDFIYTTDSETYLEIPIGNLEAGIYNFTCFFNDTMDLETNSTLTITILPNSPPVVTPLNSTYISFNEWDLGPKGSINFTFMDIDENIDEVIMSFNITGSNFVWNNESEGYAYLILANQLMAGDYFCRVWVNDTVGRSGEATINIEVLPNTPPIVTAQESEVNMTIGSILEISWNTSDTEGNYDSFIVLLDGVEINLGVWSGGEISIDVNDLNLSVGEYNLTLICNDTLGLRNQDTTIVMVIEEELTPWEQFIQWLCNLWEQLWAWIIGIISSIVALGIYVKRRNNRLSCPCRGHPNCYCDL